MCVCVCVCVHASIEMRGFSEYMYIYLDEKRQSGRERSGECQGGNWERDGFREQEMIKAQLTSSPWEGEVTSTCTMSGLTV